MKTLAERFSTRKDEYYEHALQCEHGCYFHACDSAGPVGCRCSDYGATESVSKMCSVGLARWLLVQDAEQDIRRGRR